MPTFRYRAIDEGSKETQGTIDAANLDAAKDALKDLHLEPIEVMEAMRLRKTDDTAPQEMRQLKTAYAFEGTDAQGQIHKGTIQALDRRSAFDRLKREQALTVTMLTPLGITPAENDIELKQWTDVVPMPDIIPAAATVPTPAVPVVIPPKDHAAESHPEQGETKPRPDYYPLLQTLRLYAGWLLAWYAIFVALGYYSTVRILPFEIPVAGGFFASPLVTTFMLAIFSFLLFSTIHRIIKGRLISAILLSLLGAGFFAGLRMNLV